MTRSDLSNLFGTALAVLAFLALVAPANAVDITWTASPYTNTWDGATTSQWTPAQVPTSSDDVVFPTFNSGHYTSQTVTISGTQTANSIIFQPNEVDYLHLAGGDLSGVAGGITVDHVTSNWASRLHFDRDGSYSFGGDVTVRNASWLYYGEGITAAGTYGLGGGTIHMEKVGLNKPTFNYEPTVIGTTLTNPIHVDSSLGTDAVTFYWGNAPTFTGDLDLDGNIYFASVGGGYEYFDWNGNVNLSGDRTIIGGVRDLAGGRPGGLHFTGQFTGSDHTLTLDFQNSPNVGMQATIDTGAWGVGNLILTNGNATQGAGTSNTPNLLVHTTNPTDDHFATLRANGGSVTIEDGAQLLVRVGAIDGGDLLGDSTGKIMFDQTSAVYDARIINNPLHLTSAGSGLRNAIIDGGAVPAKGHLSGDIIVGDGGQLTLDTLYGHLARHDAGDLDLRGGSTLYATWSGSTFWSAGYRLGGVGQQIRLGDGSSATTETITFLGRGDPGTGVFCFGTDTANVVDDGATILRYESVNSRRFNMGWTDLASVQSVAYSNNNVAYQFRGGSAGTEFAPLSDTYDIGAIGPASGTVFTANSPTSLVTDGTVGFYNSNDGSYNGHRGTLGPVVIDAGGSFNATVFGGDVEAASFSIVNGGSMGGIGTFRAAGGVTVTDGTVEPGNSAGTLYVEGDVTFQADGELVIEVDSDLEYDVLAVTGNLTFEVGSSLSVVDNYGAGLPSVPFDIVTATGTISGWENLVMPGQWQIDELTPGVLTIQNIPEPGALLVLALAGLAVCCRRR